MTNSKELCGQRTPSGLPCTLPKGHKIHYHRHRTYESITWEIKTTMGRLLDAGKNRVEMNNALSRALSENENLVIHIKRWNTLDG